MDRLIQELQRRDQMWIATLAISIALASICALVYSVFEENATAILLTIYTCILFYTVLKGVNK
jgi:hypothetical protein